jgi:D-amino-acid oxidase
MEPSEEAATAIVERCLHIIPHEIKEGIKSGKIPFKVLGWGAGWRPVRKLGMRCERDESASDAVVVHNYGHGGEGYCFSWGSARHVADIIDATISTTKSKL